MFINSTGCIICDEQRVDPAIRSKHENYLETKKSMSDYCNSKNHKEKTVKSNDGSYILSICNGNCTCEDTAKEEEAAGTSGTGKRRKAGGALSGGRVKIPNYA